MRETALLNQLSRYESGRIKNTGPRRVTSTEWKYLDDGNDGGSVTEVILRENGADKEATKVVKDIFIRYWCLWF